jgi:hypothetical protein
MTYAICRLPFLVSRGRLLAAAALANGQFTVTTAVGNGGMNQNRMVFPTVHIHPQNRLNSILRFSTATTGACILRCGWWN